jgi:replicative DNA helicase
VTKLYQQIKDTFDFAENPTKRVGTGLPRLDEVIGGPMPGEICMIIGRSASGKSIVGQNIIVNNMTLPSIFFSMEMPYMQAVLRMYTMWSGENATDIQHNFDAGKLPDDMWDMAVAFPQHWIEDGAGLSLETMSAVCHDFQRANMVRPEFVVIDYLELLGGAKASGDGYLATEKQATMLKDWAKLEDMRVFVLHQTNRQEPRYKPPTENSARNAGFTEADYVIGLWQPARNPELDFPERLALRNTLRFNVLKNRAFGVDVDKIDMTLQPSLRIWRPKVEEERIIEPAKSDAGQY